MRHFLLPIMAIFMLFSCHPQRSAVIVQPEETSATNGEPKIMFLQLKVWKKETGYGGEIKDKKQVPGRLNQDIRGVQLSQGEWLISFLDKKDKMVTQVTILNPLEEHYETTDDNGQLRGVEVKKDAADCFVRVQYDPRFAAIQIEQIGPAQQLTRILSLNF